MAEKNEERESGDSGNASALFWADAVAQKLEASFGRKQVIEDEKTPSGRVHVGALRGVIVHDCLFRACRDAGLDAEYIYGFDDFDALDKVLPYVDASFEKFLGAPLCNVPSPDSVAASYARQFGLEFKEAFNGLGANPKVYWTSELYKKGLFDEVIKIALQEGVRINELDQKISGAQKPSNYLPFKPVCEKCGKVATTLAFDWDGSTVAYKCADSRDAKGCGFEGRVSPFGGRGKLPWKVEWIAKWMNLGVTCEFAGKDHFTKTGSFTVSSAISREIFNHTPPYGEGYEFILVGKEKMSTSKGTGAVAFDLVKNGDAGLLRFFMAKSRPKTQISFEPESQNIILLYDEYDKLKRQFFGKEPVSSESEKNQVGRVYAMSAMGKPEEEFSLQVPFSLAVTLVQSAKGREVQALQQMKHLPALLSGSQKEQVENRLGQARKWVETYAPDEFKIKILDALPSDVAESVSDLEKELLAQAAGLIEQGASSEELQNFVYGNAKAKGLQPKDIFTKIYRLLLGKERGPRLAPFLLSLEKEFVASRLRLQK